MACQSRSRSKASELIIRRLGISPAISACSDKAPVLILVMAIVPRGSSEKSHAGRRARVAATSRRPSSRGHADAEKLRLLQEGERHYTNASCDNRLRRRALQAVVAKPDCVTPRRTRSPASALPIGENRLLSRLYASSFCDRLRRRRIFLAICEATTRFVCSAQLAGLANAGQCGRGKLQMADDWQDKPGHRLVPEEHFQESVRLGTTSDVKTRMAFGGASHAYPFAESGSYLRGLYLG